MARITGVDEESHAIHIDRSAVVEFFERRADRIAELGPTRAVIYQDKHEDLAERRDVAERAAMLPRLALDGSQRLLDVGCGTGRWVPSLAPLTAYYHGIDLTAGLVEWAREHHDLPHVRFSTAAIDTFSLESLGEEQPFDRVLCAGVLIYLNDDHLDTALRLVRAAVHEGAQLLFREPVAQVDRLSIVDHASAELEQRYNAIYRTRAELFAAFASAIPDLDVLEHGYVFDDPDLNNRAETSQEWFRLGRPG